jgi:muramoyltetrapeptide carboxypeptidase
MTSAIWKPLQPGDAVAVITPASSIDSPRLQQGIEVLRSWGLDVRLGRHVVTADNEPAGALFAGADEDRAEDLLWALTDPAIRAVFCGRGGYGLLRILDRLDLATRLGDCDRVVYGYSDITCLHAALRVHVGWPTILGPVVGTLGQTDPDEQTISALYNVLLGVDRHDAFGQRYAPGENDSLVHDSVADFSALFVADTVVLQGGSVTAEGAPPTQPFVAVLEDVTESPYRVDRLLTQLLRSGWFTNCVGVLAGTWEGCGDVEPVLRERFAAIRDTKDGVMGGPIVFNAAFGHGRKHLPVPLGVPMHFNADSRTLKLAKWR